MRKLFVVVLAVCLAGGPVLMPAFAEEKEAIDVQSLGLPDMQGGMIYSVNKSEFEACGTISALSYPTKLGDIELRAGYATDREPIGAIAFKVGDLTKFGFNQPLHKLINISVGAYVGYDFEISEWDYGPIVTVLQLKF